MSTQQVCYDMQTKTTKEANHLAVANALEDEMKGANRRVSQYSTEGGQTNLAWGTAHRGSSRTADGMASYAKDLEVIAFHLERAGKLTKAIEFYSKAGCELLSEGSDACEDLFKRCDSLAQLLGNEISPYMRGKFPVAAPSNQSLLAREVETRRDTVSYTRRCTYFHPY